MPFRAPGAGVLGPRPPFQAQHAMTAQHQLGVPNNGVPSPVDPVAFFNNLSVAGTSAQTPPSSSDWYLDTGASTHMSSNSGNLHTSSVVHPSTSITVGNGARLSVSHSASTSIPTSASPLLLNQVPVSPSLVKNLISVRKLTRDNNVSIEFDPHGFSVKDIPTNKVTLRCESSGDLYPLRLPPQLALSASSSADLWHQRLGHPGAHVLSHILADFDFHCNKSTPHRCQSCKLGKHVRLPFDSSITVSYFPFQLIHADVWTSPVLSFSGYKYYLVLLDDYTHYIWTFPMRHKSEVLPLLRDFHAYIGTQFGLRLLALQTDNGREFDSTALRFFLSAHGVALRLSCPYTSQQNGKAERALRTLNDCIRTLLIHSGASTSFWAEALSTATYLVNRRPCQATASRTP
jgi:histone deacetylase 1/2